MDIRSIVVVFDEFTIKKLRHHLLIKGMAGNTDLVSAALSKIINAVDDGESEVEIIAKRGTD